MVNGRAALFVGREKERAQVTSFITDGQFAMVCGPGGIGKTALVQVALAELEVTPHFHRCRKGDTLEELGRGLLQAIGEDAAPALEDEELAAYVLERGERRGQRGDRRPSQSERGKRGALV